MEWVPLLAGAVVAALIAPAGLRVLAESPFPAGLLARTERGSAPAGRAALAGAAIALLLVPVVPAGVPVLAAGIGVLAANGSRSRAGLRVA